MGNTDDWVAAISSGSGLGMTAVSTAHMYPCPGLVHRPLTDAPPIRVSLAWLHTRPGVVAPVVGATKVHHVTDALAAQRLTLDEPEIARLEEHYRPHALIGHR